MEALLARRTQFRDRRSQLEYPDIPAKAKTSPSNGHVEKPNSKKGLERFTQKLRGKNQAVRKKVLASEQNKEGRKPRRTPSTKEVWILIVHTSKA
jgi:hypothetical protein